MRQSNSIREMYKTIDYAHTAAANGFIAMILYCAKWFCLIVGMILIAKLFGVETN